MTVPYWAAIFIANLSVFDPGRIIVSNSSVGPCLIVGCSLCAIFDSAKQA